MTRAKIIVPVLLLTFFVTIASAQQKYTFKVLVNKGKNEIKNGNAWNPIKVGVSLSDKDEIRLAENSYVGLVHVTGKPLEVKDAGKHKVADLAQRVKNSPTVMQKYTDFILSSNEVKKNKLEATGAVHRGVNDLVIFMPQKTSPSEVYGNNIVITWDTTGVKGPYEVKLSSMFGDVLKTVKTDSNSVAINLDETSFKHEDKITLDILSRGSGRRSPEGDYLIKRLTKSERARMDEVLKEVAPLMKEETAFNQYILGGIYEQNKLLIDAVTAYQEAIRLAPEVQQYKDAFNDFILRTGFKPAEVKR